MEILVGIAIFTYIFYLRYSAKMRPNTGATAAEEGHKQAVIPGDREGTGNPPKSSGLLFDSRLFVNLLMVIGTSALIVAVVKNADGVHLPYFVAVASAVAIGFAEPHRGWLLALAQCTLIACGYFLFTDVPENEGTRELENFGLYGSMVLTLAASFLGAFLKRAMNMR